MPKSKRSPKVEEIERVAARLFACRGYHPTSMREIARSLNMNQSSLYHYFRSKEDILFKLMNDAMDDALATLEEICASDFSPEEKLRRVLRFYTRYFAGDQEGLILLVNEMHGLGKNYHEILIEKQRRYVTLIESILSELSSRDKMKEIPHAVAAFAFFGMVHYTIKWYRPDGPVGVDELSNLFVEIFTGGILE